jgi:hypothetical protein
VHYAQWPLSLAELEAPDAHVDRLFRRLFRCPPPDYPRHFVVWHRGEGAPTLAAYVHFTEHEPGVFLIGGLGVDASVYRRLSPEVRAQLAGEGSLSRWLLRHAIEALGPKRAVFAYTGDTRSRRDVLALGMARSGEHLFVQWHDQPEAQRPALLARVAALGPF